MSEEVHNIVPLDKKEFIALYDQLGQRIYRIAFLYTKDSELSNDILQEVFLTLWKDRNILKNRVRSMEAYLFQSARNKALDAIRKENSRRLYQENLRSKLVIASDDTEQAVAFRMLQQEIHDIISLLPDKCRTVYQLSRAENLDNKTIAFKLNISEKTVKNHLTRAQDFLKSQLKSKKYN